VQTLVGGQVVFEHGRIIGEPRGRFVQPHSTARALAREA
jgi:hypothetical protein